MRRRIYKKGRDAKGVRRQNIKVVVLGARGGPSTSRRESTSCFSLWLKMRLRIRLGNVVFGSTGVGGGRAGKMHLEYSYYEYGCLQYIVQNVMI